MSRVKASELEFVDKGDLCDSIAAIEEGSWRTSREVYTTVDKMARKGVFRPIEPVDVDPLLPVSMRIKGIPLREETRLGDIDYEAYRENVRIRRNNTRRVGRLKERHSAIDGIDPLSLITANLAIHRLDKGQAVTNIFERKGNALMEDELRPGLVECIYKGSHLPQPILQYVMAAIHDGHSTQVNIEYLGFAEVGEKVCYHEIESGASKYSGRLTKALFGFSAASEEETCYGNHICLPRPVAVHEELKDDPNGAIAHLVYLYFRKGETVYSSTDLAGHSRGARETTAVLGKLKDA